MLPVIVVITPASGKYTKSLFSNSMFVTKQNTSLVPEQHYWTPDFERPSIQPIHFPEVSNSHLCPFFAIIALEF